MKKNYIEPRITVMTCSSEYIMQTGSPGTESFTGNETKGPGAGSEQEEVGSKSNSGLLNWDDEEE